MTGIPRWRSVTRRTLDLFGRWGDSRTQLRAMLDHIIPVVVVDRFRDDQEGSMFGIHARGGRTGTETPSVSFGSAVNDWELHKITSLSYSASNRPFTIGAHMFNPIAPYNPATFLSPVGLFAPALINNRAFTFGTVNAIGGSNPTLPAIVGPSVVPFLDNPGNLTLEAFTPIDFDPPIRVYRDSTLTFQWFGDSFQPGGLSLFVDIIYSERPKVSQP